MMICSGCCVAMAFVVPEYATALDELRTYPFKLVVTPLVV